MPPAAAPNHPAAGNHHPNPMSMSSQDQSWFMGAPATMVLVVGLVLIHTAWTQIRRQEEYRNHGAAAFSVALSRCTFETSGELVMGTLLLLYLSRRYEREMGTQQFVAWVVTVWLFAAVFLLEAIWILSDVALGTEFRRGDGGARGRVGTGPYALLGALFCYYHLYAPRLYPRFVSLFGLSLSEKSFYYGWFGQVVFSNRTSGLLPALCGIAVASVLSSHGTWTLPARWFGKVEDFLKSTVQAPPRVLVATVPPTANRIHPAPPRAAAGAAAPEGVAAARPFHAAAAAQAAAAAGAGGGAGTARRRRHNASSAATSAASPSAAAAVAADRTDGFASLAAAASAAAAAPFEPDPEALESLVSMGFDRQQVVQALRHTNNDAHRAADRLLQGS